MKLLVQALWPWALGPTPTGLAVNAWLAGKAARQIRRKNVAAKGSFTTIHGDIQAAWNSVNNIVCFVGSTIPLQTAL